MTAAELPGALTPDSDGTAANGEVRIQAEDPVRALHELTAWALARSVPLTELEVRQPNLEDVYLELTADTPEEVPQ